MTDLTDPTELTDEEKLQMQLPPEEPDVPFDMGYADFPDVDADPRYSIEPPDLRTIPLLKERYPNRKRALIRAREICLGTGERIHRFFESGRAWVAQVTKPVQR